MNNLHDRGLQQSMKVSPSRSKDLVDFRIKLIVNMSVFLAIVLLFSGCFGLGKGGQSVKPLGSYKIYTNTGQESDIENIVKTAMSADVLFIGETHDDPVAHELEIKLVKALHKKLSVPSNNSLNKTIVLSLEFFGKDVQTSLDEYLDGLIIEKHFRDSARVWPNYMTDYRPLIEYAKENKIDVIAANAPRRYVNMVSRNGRESLDALSATAKSWLPPLPYGKASALYMAKLDKLNKSIMENMKKGKKSGKFMKKNMPKKNITEKSITAKKNTNDSAKMKPNSAGTPFVDHNAQSLWDASMAWSILQALNNSHDRGLEQSMKVLPPRSNDLVDFPIKSNGEKNLVININGSFHCENMLGIPEHLMKYSPDAKIVVVTIKPVENFSAVEQNKKRNDDFVIYTIKAR